MIEPRVAVYGIRTCDTMKKARAFLDARGIAYAFHDFKVEGIEEGRLRRWIELVGWETLLNRASTTFRRVPEIDRLDLTEDKAVALMLAQPAMIKRPVLEAGHDLIVGFAPARYESLR